MLDTLITSKTRIKLLIKFFLNSNNSAYLRNLESEFGESSNAIRIELNKFEEAGLLTTAAEGNKKVFKANIKHPLFKSIQNLLMRYVGVDQVIDEVVEKIGDVKKVYLTGELSKGIDSPIIDLMFVGNLNKDFLIKLIDKVEKLINKKIRYVIYSDKEIINQKEFLSKGNHFLIWSDTNQKQTHLDGN